MPPSGSRIIVLQLLRYWQEKSRNCFFRDYHVHIFKQKIENHIEKILVISYEEYDFVRNILWSCQAISLGEGLEQGHETELRTRQSTTPKHRQEQGSRKNQTRTRHRKHKNQCKNRNFHKRLEKDQNKGSNKTRLE